MKPPASVSNHPHWKVSRGFVFQPTLGDLCHVNASNEIVACLPWERSEKGSGAPFFTGDGKAAKLVIGGDHASEYTILYNKQPYNTTSIYLIYTIHT